ncbi:MAG: HAD family hydrolase [Chloroflexota bacterium]|jgi:HAD superfamily hydrolase (TIGR01549 family)
MTIQAIIFDLGGTLIEYAGPHDAWPELETPGFTAAYGVWQQAGLKLPDFERVRQAGFARLPRRWRQATLGEANLRLVDLLAETLADCDLIAISPELLTTAATQYQTAIQQQAAMIPDAPQVLAGLKAAGYRLGLLSNTMFTGAAHVADLERFGLAGYFDTMLFSGDAGKWKPTAAPFLQVAEELGVGPETAVYVGDDPASDIVGGRRAGMRTIHFQSSDRFPTPNGVIPHARVGRLADLPQVIAEIGKR